MATTAVSAIGNTLGGRGFVQRWQGDMWTQFLKLVPCHLWTRMLFTRRPTLAYTVSASSVGSTVCKFTPQGELAPAMLALGTCKCNRCRLRSNPLTTSIRCWRTVWLGVSHRTRRDAHCNAHITQPWVGNRMLRLVWVCVVQNLYAWRSRPVKFAPCGICGLRG